MPYIASVTLTGRLEDKSAIVRKQALLALASMLTFNPFAPQLPEDRFTATLEEYQRKLKVRSLTLQSPTLDCNLHWASLYTVCPLGFRGFSFESEMSLPGLEQ